MVHRFSAIKKEGEIELKENIFKMLLWTEGNIFPNKGKPLGMLEILSDVYLHEV